MKENKFFLSLGAALLLLLCFISVSCDILEADQIPELKDLTQIDAYSIDGGRLALDLETLFPGLQYTGVSESVNKQTQYLTEGVKRPLLLYQENENIDDFQIEFEDQDGGPVIANVNIKKAAKSGCAAENFTGVTINKNTRFTIDFFLNEDLCAARDAERIFSTFVFVINGDETPFNPIPEYNYKNRTLLEGMFLGDPGIFENNLALYTLIPDSAFTGIMKFKYTVAVNYDTEAGHDPRDIYENPELSEYYSHHEATITIE